MKSKCSVGSDSPCAHHGSTYDETLSVCFPQEQDQFNVSRGFLRYLQEKDMSTHSGILAWEIPWTEEPGRLTPMGMQRVGQD